MRIHEIKPKPPSPKETKEREILNNWFEMVYLTIESSLEDYYHQNQEIPAIIDDEKAVHFLETAVKETAYRVYNFVYNSPAYNGIVRKSKKSPLFRRFQREYEMELRETIVGLIAGGFSEKEAEETAIEIMKNKLPKKRMEEFMQKRLNRFLNAVENGFYAISNGRKIRVPGLLENTVKLSEALADEWKMYLENPEDKSNAFYGVDSGFKPSYNFFWKVLKSYERRKKIKYLDELEEVPIPERILNKDKPIYFEGENYYIGQLETKYHLEEEGALLDHCVSCYDVFSENKKGSAKGFPRNMVFSVFKIIPPTEIDNFIEENNQYFQPAYLGIKINRLPILTIDFETKSNSFKQAKFKNNSYIITTEDSRFPLLLQALNTIYEHLQDMGFRNIKFTEDFNEIQPQEKDVVTLKGEKFLYEITDDDVPLTDKTIIATLKAEASKETAMKYFELNKDNYALIVDRFVFRNLKFFASIDKIHIPIIFMTTKTLDEIGFPEEVSDVYFETLENAGVLFFRKRSGKIEMPQLKKANRIILPFYSKGINLRFLEDFERLILPQEVNGSIDLTSLPPEKVGNIIVLNPTSFKISGKIIVKEDTKKAFIEEYPMLKDKLKVNK